MNEAENKVKFVSPFTDEHGHHENKTFEKVLIFKKKF